MLNRGGSSAGAVIPAPREKGNFLPSLKERVLVSAAVLACLFLAADEWFLFHRSYSKTQRISSSKDGRFSLPLASIFYPNVVREGDVHLVASERLAGIEVLVPTTSNSVGPRKSRFRMISPKRYAVPAAEDLTDWTIRLTPARAGVRTMKVEVIFRPVFRPSVFFVKVLFVFFISLLFLTAAVWILRMLWGKTSADDGLVRLIATGFLGTAAAAVLEIVFHPGSFFGFAGGLGARLPRILAFNAALGAGLTLVYLIFRKYRLRLYIWPLLLSALGLLIYPDYRVPICGDSSQWMSILNLKSRLLFGAEFLSFPLTKAILHLCRVFVPSVTSSFAQVLTAKLMGILTLIALTVFISGETRFSREKKALFLILASTFGFQAFLIGYPEFAYFPLPFLLAAAISARRFLSPEGGRNRDLVLAAVWAAVAGLFHGSAWVVLPAVFLLPILRAGKNGRPRGFGTLVKGWALSGGAAAMVIVAAFGAARLLGFKISFQNITGGGDRGMFVDFFSGRQTNSNGVLVFEMRYLWERAWALLLAVPLPLLVWASLSLRKFKDELIDRFLLAAGVFLLVIFYFWNFDLGYRDFDLYTAPLTLIALVLLKFVLEIKTGDASSRWEPALVFLFALASPVLLILQMTTQSLF
ncbi:MAG: hypothetical protein NTW38_11955 [Candidatus Aminicenantes bacterium]|nr:hypothetical protein [Candidatus Aminicenantes bacterium]